MGIRVECPHGHVFKVKDKYAGKRGLCPHCKGQVEVRVPQLMSANETDQAYRQAVVEENRVANAPPPPPSSSSSIFDDQPASQDSGISGSLLNSSVIRHDVKCSCGTKVPMWYARCPKCGTYINHG